MLLRTAWTSMIVAALTAIQPLWGFGPTPVAAAPATFSVTATGEPGLWSPNYCYLNQTVCQPNEQTYTFALPSNLTANDVTSATLHLNNAGIQVHIPGSSGETHENLPPSTCTTAMTAADFAVRINSSLERSL